MNPGGRRSLVLVQPVHLTATPTWATGPLPLHAGTITASTTARSSYFTPPCARILYGTSTQPTRWHTFLHDDPATDPHTGLAVWHVTATGENHLELLRAVAGRPTDHKLPDLDTVLRPFATVSPATRAFTIAFMTWTGLQPPPPRGISPHLGWPPTQAWLWLLASRTTPADYPPDPAHADRLLAGTIALSADWRGLIVRDGAAFVALRPDRGTDDPFLSHAQLFTHTTYLDALLLGMIQRASVEQMVTDSATAFDAPDMPCHLEQLQARTARFRTIYWLRDASNHGPANDILDAYQAQHGLPERFDAVVTEIADLARILQDRQAQRTGAALGILTIVGLPFGIALETLQALGTSSPTSLTIGLITAATVTGALLTTRVGRLLVHQIRQLK